MINHVALTPENLQSDRLLVGLMGTARSRICVGAPKAAITPNSRMSQYL